MSGSGWPFHPPLSVFLLGHKQSTLVEKDSAYKVCLYIHCQKSILQGKSHKYLFSLQKLTGLRWKVFDILIKLNIWNICCIFYSAGGSPQVYYLPKTFKNGLTLKMDPIFSTDCFDYFK